MPRITKIRITGTKYDGFRKRHENTLLNLTRDENPDHTLFTLTNTSGKGVMMQLMSQILLPGTAWGINGGNKVTGMFINHKGEFVPYTFHVLIEWKLDTLPEKWLITGICVTARQKNIKKGSEEEERDDKLGIQYFLHVSEHDNRGFPSVEDMPVFDAEKNAPVDYEIFEKFINDKRHIFRRFSKSAVESNNSEYYDYLEQKGIYRNEWDILKLINRSEGDIRSYFAKAMDNRSLFDTLIIPAISENISLRFDEEGRNVLKSMFRSSASIAKNLPVLIERQEDYRKLLDSLQQLIKDCEMGMSLEKRYQDCITDGNNLFHAVKSMLSQIANETEKWNREKEKVDEIQRDTRFEKDNLEYARQLREKQKLEEQKSEVEKIINEIIDEKRRLEDELKLHRIRKYLILRERDIKQLNRKTAERDRLMADYQDGSTQHRLEELSKEIGSKWAKTSERWSRLEEQHSAYTNSIERKKEELEGILNDLQKQLTKINTDEELLKRLEQRLEEKKEGLLPKYDLFSLEFPENILEELCKQEQALIAKSEKLENQQIQIEEQLAGLSQSIAADETREQIFKENTPGLENDYHQKKEFEEAVYTDMVHALKLEADKEAYSRAWLAARKIDLENEIENKKDRLLELRKELWLNNIDLSLNSEDFWIPNRDVQELRDIIVKTGIKVEYGTKYLKSLEGEERAGLLEGFPMLPYGLVILDEDAYSVLIKNIAREKLFLRSAVPVFVMSGIREGGQPAFRMLKNEALDLALDSAAFEHWKGTISGRDGEIKKTLQMMEETLSKLNDIFSRAKSIKAEDDSFAAYAKLKHHREQIDGIGKRLEENRRIRKELGGQRDGLKEERRGIAGSLKNYELDKIALISLIEMKSEVEKKRAEMLAIEQQKKILHKRKEEAEGERRQNAASLQLEIQRYTKWEIRCAEEKRRLSKVLPGIAFAHGSKTDLLVQREPDYDNVLSDDPIFADLAEWETLQGDIEKLNRVISLLQEEIDRAQSSKEANEKELKKLDPNWGTFDNGEWEGVSLETVESRIEHQQKLCKSKDLELNDEERKNSALKAKLDMVEERLPQIISRIKERHDGRNPKEWLDIDLNSKEKDIQNRQDDNHRYAKVVEAALSSLAAERRKAEDGVLRLEAVKILDDMKGASDEALILNVRKDAAAEILKWDDRHSDIKKTMDRHLHSCRNNTNEFADWAKRELKDERLKKAMNEALSERYDVSDYKTNLGFLSSVCEHSREEINRISTDVVRAEEHREQWSSRAAMHVLKIIECLREMVGKMVYINDNSNIFPLVRLKGAEQLPKEEDELVHVLKDYFLECIRMINERGLDADDLDEGFLDKYMSDRSVFSRALRGRYPVLEVYKMTESNEFLYAAPQDYNYATWEAINRGQGDSPEGSGGQKLAVSAFVMMMLMNYKKRIFSGESPWTVLIMDNPFGQASSGHVLDPVFKIAYKLNFQLIAFASPEIIKSEISERFPVFWALKIADAEEEVKKGTVVGRVVHGGRVIRQ